MTTLTKGTQTINVPEEAAHAYLDDGWSLDGRSAPAEPLGLVLIAVDKKDAQKFLTAHPEHGTPTAIVTVRSPAAARGRTAAGYLTTPAIDDHPKLEQLIAEVTPAIATEAP